MEVIRRAEEEGTGREERRGHEEGQRHSKIPFPFGFIGSEINEV